MATITLTFDLNLENVESLRKLALALHEQAKDVDYLEQLAHERGIPIHESEEPSAKTTAGKPKSGATKKETSSTETDSNEKKPIGLTEVRAVALKLSQAGRQSTLQSIFANFGAKKLSDIPQEEYPALMEELGAAVNG